MNPLRFLRTCICSHQNQESFRQFLLLLYSPTWSLPRFGHQFSLSLKCFAWLPQTGEDANESGLSLRDCRVWIWISQISLEFNWWIYSATYGKVYLPFLHHRLTSKSRRSCWRDPGRESASHCRVEGTCHCRLFLLRSWLLCKLFHDLLVLEFLTRIAFTRSARNSVLTFSLHLQIQHTYSHTRDLYFWAYCDAHQDLCGKQIYCTSTLPFQQFTHHPRFGNGLVGLSADANEGISHPG